MRFPFGNPVVRRHRHNVTVLMLNLLRITGPVTQRRSR
jgi:hypothetical protein